MCETGAMSGEDVQMLTLPRSQFQLQWRAKDSMWRALPANQPELQDEAWAEWRPGEDSFVRSYLDSGRASHTQTWWVLYGEAPSEQTVTVALAGGSQPPVLGVGRLWACEWVGTAQDVRVKFAGKSEVLFPLRHWAETVRAR